MNQARVRFLVFIWLGPGLAIAPGNVERARRKIQFISRRRTNRPRGG